MALLTAYNLEIKLNFPIEVNISLKVNEVFFYDDKGNKVKLNPVRIHENYLLKPKDILLIERILNRTVFLTYADIVHGELKVVRLDFDINAKNVYEDITLHDYLRNCSANYIIEYVKIDESYDVSKIIKKSVLSLPT